MTTTRTLLGSLALCISLASASSRASTTSERASHQPSSGSGENWTAALPVRPAARSQHHAAHYGEALRQDAPEEERVLRSGADAFALKRTKSGKEVKAFALKHSQEYEGANEETRKLTTKGGELVDLEVDMNVGFRTQAHAHVGQAIVAARQQEQSAEVAAYYANVEQLKVERDMEQKKLIEKKYTNANESEETRYAPNLGLHKAFPRIAELGEYVEGVWKPKALTKAELTRILGEGSQKLVVDQDDQAYDYLHPVTLQKAQMVAFSTDPQMVKANKKYAERADEFFWRRAPAVFTPAGQRVVTKAGQADHRRAVMRNARANAQGSVKIIDLGDGRKPWTQKHFEQYVKHTGLAEEWHSYGACRRVDAAAVAEAKYREEAYEHQLMRDVLNKQIRVQEELIAERPWHPRAKLNKLRADLEKFEADILAMWVGRIPGAGAY